MKIEKIGMRTIKTAFAVSFTIFISNILNLKSPFFAGIAAIIAMQTSVSESLSRGKDRMYGTVFGAVVAMLFSYLAPENVISTGIGILIIIYICNILGLKKSIQLSTMVFLSIILNHDEGSRLNYALYRTMDTLVGLIIGTAINYFIVPPNMEARIEEMIDKTYFEIKGMIEGIIYQGEKPSLEDFKKYLIDMEENYTILKKDSRLSLGKPHDTSNYDWIFTAFSNIYSNLKIILSIEKSPIINERNRRALEEIFDKEITSSDEDSLDELDLVYNYHLNELLNGLNHIDECLSRIKEQN